MAMLVFVFIAASLIIIQTTATYSQQDFMCFILPFSTWIRNAVNHNKCTTLISLEIPHNISY